MDPQKILDTVRQTISDYAGNDRDKWFYANRFVFARLQLDERKTKTKIKKKLIESNIPCHYCNKPFEKKTGIHLHRLSNNCGYSSENCVLMHSDCHIKFHAENPKKENYSYSSLPNTPDSAFPTLEKESKRYEEKEFIYWWDISPGFLEKIDKYEAVEFAKKDNGERCYVPTTAFKGYLTKERQTTRGQGNWGIRVLKNREAELAFEPPDKNGKWLFLPVVWVNDKEED
jgi:hypothetical protein